MELVADRRRGRARAARRSRRGRPASAAARPCARGAGQERPADDDPEHRDARSPRPPGTRPRCPGRRRRAGRPRTRRWRGRSRRTSCWRARARAGPARPRTRWHRSHRLSLCASRQASHSARSRSGLTSVARRVIDSSSWGGGKPGDEVAVAELDERRRAARRRPRACRPAGSFQRRRCPLRSNIAGVRPASASSRESRMTTTPRPVVRSISAGIAADRCAVLAQDGVLALDVLEAAARRCARRRSGRRA